MPAKKTRRIQSFKYQDDHLYQQNDLNTDTKDVKALKIENNLWNQTYNEIFKLIKEVIPLPDEITKKSSNKQNSLLNLTREVIKIAKNPKESKEYKELLRRMEGCQRKMNDLIQKNDLIANDIYDLSLTKNNDIEIDKSQMTIRLNNLDAILTREIEQNREFLPNNMTSFQPTKKEEPSLSKKPSNILLPSQKKKGKSVFPSVSELLSPSFNKRPKNGLFQLTNDNSDIQSVAGINDTKSEIRVTIIKSQSAISNQPNQIETQKVISTDETKKEEIPFSKRPPRKRVRIEK